MSSNTEVAVLQDGRMDTASAAAYLGRRAKTLANWRSKRVGPPFVKRFRVYYYKADLDAWLREGRKRTGEKS